MISLKLLTTKLKQIELNMIQTDQQLKYLHCLGELRKYDYLTGEDLAYRPSVLEQTKFDYSLLGRVFNMRLDDKTDHKERLLKRLKNIEDKNEDQLKEIKDEKAKKLSKATQTTNALFYDTNHDFRRYRVSKFLKISSIESKFDEFEPFHKMFVSLKNLDVEEENIV